MEPIGIAEQLSEKFPGFVLEINSHRDQVSVRVDRSPIVAMCHYLQHEHGMNHLSCLCGVDHLTRQTARSERFEVIYQLYSIHNRVALRLGARIPESDPCIDSIVPLWTGANWLERETYDLVGITFNNHPNLKRILTPDSWQGHPLRKEYPLRGETEWQGFTELKEKAALLKQYDFHNARKNGQE